MSSQESLFLKVRRWKVQLWQPSALATLSSGNPQLWEPSALGTSGASALWSAAH